MLDLSKRKKTGNKYPKRTGQKVTNQGEESWLLLTPKQSDPRLSFREYIKMLSSNSVVFVWPHLNTREG